MTITENIENHILSELNKATISIDIAVAWITSQRIIDKIIEKREKEVRIRILCKNDAKNTKLRKAFGQLKRKQFEFYYIEDIHTKFCIIDDKIVISGSYNWTEGAKGNIENITISELDEKTKPLQVLFNTLRNKAIREIDNRKFKEEVLEDAKIEIIQGFEQKIEYYIECLSERNKSLFKGVEDRINEQRVAFDIFEQRTRLYKRMLIFCVVSLLISFGIMGISAKLAMDWYEKSILTKQEAKEELLEEFEQQKMKLYPIEEYQNLEKNNQIVEEWIKKNPRDSRKFVEYRNKYKY